MDRVVDQQLTLITLHALLTATHCLTGSADPKAYRIVLTPGSSDCWRQRRESRTRKLTSFHIHDQYVDSRFETDIAVLKMADPAHILDHVYPGCFPIGVENQTRVVLSWWGRTAPERRILHLCPSRQLRILCCSLLIC